MLSDTVEVRHGSQNITNISLTDVGWSKPGEIDVAIHADFGMRSSDRLSFKVVYETPTGMRYGHNFTQVSRGTHECKLLPPVYADGQLGIKSVWIESIGYTSDRAIISRAGVRLHFTIL